MKNLSLTIVFAFACLFPKFSWAQNANDILGDWYNQEGTAKIHIFMGSNGQFKGKYYGKIVWLKEPNKNGKPKVDDLNPDAAKRSRPVIGLNILNDFTYDSDDKEWTDGTIYDPKNGKTYSCTITKNGDKLNVRGYIGISVIGRTAIWTKAN